MKTLTKILTGFAILTFVCSVSLPVRAADQPVGQDGKMTAENADDAKDVKSGDATEKKDMKVAPKKDMSKGKKPMKHAKKHTKKDAHHHHDTHHKGHSKKDMKKDDMKKHEGEKAEEHKDAGAGEKY